MREIILDTETTGLNPRDGHRVVEIGCVEVVNYIPTGNHFHRYLNPERLMPAEAAAIHGLTDDFLADKPLFASVVGEWLDFIGDAPLIIHNAAFDVGFLNAELVRCGFPPMPIKRAVDTVEIARRKFPGLRNSLDALCERFSINKSARTFHGALLDAQLLAEVYLELRGGRQPGLVIDEEDKAAASSDQPIAPRIFRAPRLYQASPEELAAHLAMMAQIKNPLWQRQD